MPAQLKKKFPTTIHCNFENRTRTAKTDADQRDYQLAAARLIPSHGVTNDTAKRGSTRRSNTQRHSGNGI